MCQAYWGAPTEQEPSENTGTVKDLHVAAQENADDAGRGVEIVECVSETWPSGLGGA